MKKALVLTLTIALALSLLTACGGNSGNSGNSGNNNTSNTNNTSSSQSGDANQNTGETSGMLSPPSWLIGEWVTAEGEYPHDEDVVVTSNNVVVSSGSLDFSWQMKNVGLEVKESEDGGIYRLEYTAGGMDFSYVFAKQDDGSMTMTILDMVTFRYTKR